MVNYLKLFLGLIKKTLLERPFEKRIQKEINMINDGYFKHYPIVVMFNRRVFESMSCKILAANKWYYFEIDLPQMYPIKRPIIKMLFIPGIFFKK